MKRLATLAFATLTGLSAAQSPLDILAAGFPSNNGGGVNTGVYFDLDYPNFTALIHDIDVETSSTFAGGLEIYTCTGRHTAGDPISGISPLNDPGAWTLVATATTNGPGLGRGANTDCVLSNPILVNQGVTGFFILKTTISNNYYGTGPWIPAPATVATANGDCILTTGGSGTALDPVTGLVAPGYGYASTPRTFVGAIHYTPANGLFPRFSQDVTSGASPLTVNFTDTTFTNDPGGVLLVEFDFDDDGVFDAGTTGGGVVANTYGCGTYDVVIRATDSLHGTASATVTGAVIADPIAGLSISGGDGILGFGASRQFGVSGAPAGATFDWDLDGDGLSGDSMIQNPTFAYAAAGVVTVSCDVTVSCNTVTLTTSVETSPIAGAVFAADGPTGTFSTFVIPAGRVLRGHQRHQPGRLSGGGDLPPLHPDEHPARPRDLAAERPADHRGRQLPRRQLHPDLNGFRDLVRDVQRGVPGRRDRLPPGSRGHRPRHCQPYRRPHLARRQRGDLIRQRRYHHHPAVVAHRLRHGHHCHQHQQLGRGLSGKPLDDLYPGFAADVTAGLSPLTVNFNDTSVTNDPIGILSWYWDFENDGLVDDINQNPTFTYAGCGDFDVSLTVVDATNGSRTLVKPMFISTDEFSASFTQDATLISTSGVLNLTYTGDPPPRSAGTGTPMGSWMPTAPPL